MTESVSRSISTSLLQRAKSREEEAWTQLVLAFTPIVDRWFRTFGVPEHDVADLRQDVFIRVTNGLSRFERTREQGSFRGWLWQIARNCAHDYFRRGQWQQIGTDWLGQIPADDDPSESQADDVRLIHVLIEQLRHEVHPTTFDMFWRCVMDGEPASQVAADLALKPSTVREAKRRVLLRLTESCRELLGRDCWPLTHLT